MCDHAAGCRALHPVDSGELCVLPAGYGRGPEELVGSTLRCDMVPNEAQRALISIRLMAAQRL
jgi:hypothetical protein